MHFVVITGQGDEWDLTKPMREQSGWSDHAAFMNRLADERFIVLGGPLGDASTALLVIQAASEEAVRARLAKDPWVRLRPIVSIQSWDILLGDL